MVETAPPPESVDMPGMVSGYSFFPSGMKIDEGGDLING
jgi:hypothetical protein